MARQFGGRERVGHHGFRDDQSACSRQPLQQTEAHERRDTAREHTARRGHDEERQAGEKRAFAAVLVGDGADEHLPHGQPQHTCGEAHLHHGDRSPEAFRQFRQAGQVEVRDEGAERRQVAQDEEECFLCHALESLVCMIGKSKRKKSVPGHVKANQTYVLGHHILLFRRQKYPKIPARPNIIGENLDFTASPSSRPRRRCPWAGRRDLCPPSCSGRRGNRLLPR